MTNLQRCFYLILVVASVSPAQLIPKVNRTKGREESPVYVDENEKYSSGKTSDPTGSLHCYTVETERIASVPIAEIRVDHGENSMSRTISPKIIIIPQTPEGHSSRKLLATNLSSSSASGDVSFLPSSISSDCFSDYNCTTSPTINADGNISATSWNDSYEDYLNQIEEFIFPRTWTWILIFIHSLVFVIGLMGNTLVCVAVYRNHTMRTVTNYFIVNLAVADFMVILFCLPPTLIWDVTMTWFFGVTMCKIVLYLQTVSVTVSVLTLTFISIDRWYAICYPLKFKSTTGRAKTAIFVIWLLALLFDIPELIVYRTRKPDLQVDTIYFTQCSTSWSRRADTSWTLLKMILLYGVPLIFMSATYCQIVRVLWKSGCGGHQPIGTSAGNNRSVSTFPNTNVNLEGQLRSRKKAAKMLVAVVVMFAFCYFPVHLLAALRIMINLTNSDMNRALSLISHWLCYANSAVNPIIYNFMSGKFRKEFRRAFDCCSSTEDSLGYEMNSVCCKNPTRDTGLASTYSRSFRRTNTCRRTWMQERNFDDRRSTRTSLVRMDL